MEEQSRDIKRLLYLVEAVTHQCSGEVYALFRKPILKKVIHFNEKNVTESRESLVVTGHLLIAVSFGDRSNAIAEYTFDAGWHEGTVTLRWNDGSIIGDFSWSYAPLTGVVLRPRHVASPN